MKILHWCLFIILVSEGLLISTSALLANNLPDLVISRANSKENEIGRREPIRIAITINNQEKVNEADKSNNTEYAQFTATPPTKPDISSINDDSANEGDEIIFTIDLASRTLQDETYYYATYHGRDATAEPEDYRGVTTRTGGMFLANRGSRSFDIHIDTHEDSDVEDDETFYVYVRREESDIPNNTPGQSKYRGTGTILNDDSVAKPDISSINDDSANEGDEIIFTIDLASRTLQDETYYYATYHGRDATAEPEDYRGVTTRTGGMFLANRGSRSFDIHIDTHEDSDVEDDETFYVYVRREESDIPNNTPGQSKYRGTGTILNDDSVAKPDISSINDDSANEGDEIIFTIDLASRTLQDETYYYATYHGRDATAEPEDYRGVTTRTGGMFLVNRGSRSFDIHIDTHEDSDVEDDETFYVYVRREESDIPNNTPGQSKYRGTGTILNDDSVAKPDISSINDDSANEGDEIIFTIDLASRTLQDETYYYATYHGRDATAEPEDYRGVTTRTGGMFLVNRGSRSFDIHIDTHEDSDVEDDETFYVYVRREESDIPNNTPGQSKYRGTGTILNDDSVAKPDISSINDDSANEGDEIIFTIDLASRTLQDETYYYATYHGRDATAEPEDYRGVTTRTGGMFLANRGSRSFDIHIDTHEDSDVEDDETFYVYVRREESDIPNNTPGQSKYRGTGTILNDDETTVARLTNLYWEIDGIIINGRHNPVVAGNPAKMVATFDARPSGTFTFKIQETDWENGVIGSRLVPDNTVTGWTVTASGANAERDGNTYKLEVPWTAVFDAGQEGSPTPTEAEYYFTVEKNQQVLRSMLDDANARSGSAANRVAPLLSVTEPSLTSLHWEVNEIIINGRHNPVVAGNPAKMVATFDARPSGMFTFKIQETDWEDGIIGSRLVPDDTVTGWTVTASGANAEQDGNTYKLEVPWTAVFDAGQESSPTPTEAEYYFAVEKNQQVLRSMLDDANARSGSAANRVAPLLSVTISEDICSRTQQVRDAIQDRLQESDCRDVTVDELRNITGTLTIDRENIRTLDENDFDNLTRLEALELDFNFLTNLPDNIFNDLSSLTELFLHNNELVNLQTGVFDGLTNLTFLDLDRNKLTNLQMGAFDGLTNLTVIELRRNTSLTSVQTGVFNSLTSLMRLELSENGLTMLPSGVFSGLTALTNLDLKDNNLAILSSGIFNGLTALTDLDLRNNNLTILPSGVFSGLITLENLNLRDNNLAMLPTGVFDEVLDTLSDLDIDNTLRGTVSIEPLTASIMPGTVQTLTAQLTGTLPSTMRLTVTKTGNITAPATVTIPAEMISATFDITLTTETAVGNAGTVTLNTPVLLYTDALGNTRANTEPNVVFSLVNPLDVAANTHTLTAIQPLETVNICSRTPEVETAIILQITETNCAAVPQTQLNTVTMLDLSGTETEFDSDINIPVLNSIPPLKTGDFANLPNLQTLNLFGNDLTSLPENIFDGLSNLQTLNLENNDLTSPLHENTFNGLSNLQDLDLENNDLTLLPENIFGGLSSLQELDLRNNNLISLPIGIFNDTLGTLTELRLDDTLKDSISIEPRTASIMPGTIQTLTAQLTGALPSTMRLTVTKTDNITAPATVTIPAGMTSATFDIALATETAISNAGTVTLSAPVLLYTDALGNTRANTEPNVVFSLVNPLDAATNTFTFIVPDTTADYDSTADITITEGGGTAASAERTLIFGHALNAQTIVSFELTGGTLGVQGVTTNPDLIFTVGDSETEPTIDANGMTNGRFNIPAGTTSVILTFKAITDTDGDDETITFRITGIEFSGSGTATDIPTAALPSKLTIRITDAGADAIVIVDGGDTSISELLPGSTGESAVIRVKLTNIPSTATSAAIGFTLGGTATRETDYTITLAGSSTAADSVTITDADIAGTAPGVPQGGASGSAEATLIFHALNDSADIENESIVLTINSVTFEGAPASNLMSTDIAGSSQTITITDRPTSPRAVISVGEAKITEGDGLSENPNFRITFINIDSSTPGATGMMNYTFDDGFSAAASPNPLECADGAGKYCAFSSISNSLAGLTNNTGSFSFTVSSINGVSAEISIFILPREDPDAEDETVELTINSITVPQSEGTLTFNIANGNLVNSDNNPTDKVQITIADDALRLRIRVFLEGVMH